MNAQAGCGAQKTASSFDPEGSKYQTQVIRLGGQHLCSSQPQVNFQFHFNVDNLVLVEKRWVKEKPCQRSTFP